MNIVIVVIATTFTIDEWNTSCHMRCAIICGGEQLLQKVIIRLWLGFEIKIGVGLIIETKIRKCAKNQILYMFSGRFP